MKINRITDRISVSEQITPDDVPAIAAAGFATVINNRPDGEAAGQPGCETIRAAVEKAGMRFVNIPFAAGHQSAQDLAAFDAALSASSGPVFAYCRSGTRSASIWAMTQAGKRPADDILAATSGAGYDLAALRPALDALASQG